MNPLAALTGRAVDRALGLPTAAEPYSVCHDVAVPMPDGVVLLGDHYRPTTGNGALPVVLIRSPYGRAGLAALLFAAPLARRGFQVFIQSTRGTFGSGGQFRPFLHEQSDGLATVAWVRDQSWCDGRISMTGGSYLGHTQWAIAPYVDPPLESVSLNITAAKITAAFYINGAPGLKNALNWTGIIGRQERRLTQLPNPIQLAKMKRALRKLPLQAADLDVAGAPVAFWRDFVDHARPGDDFWAGADHHCADLTRMPPVSMVTGWWDLFLPEQMRDFAALRAAGVHARITVGPWLHGEPAELRAICQQDVAWLDQHLASRAGPGSAPVRLSLQPIGRWLEFDQWPPPQTTYVDFYLRLAGSLAREPEAAAPSAPATFVYDPADPTPTAGGPMLQPPGKQVDNSAIEARPDVLTYTSEPFAASQDLVGPVSARIFVRTQREHADLFVRLCDVDDRGVSRNVVDGIRRLGQQTKSDAALQVDGDGVAAVEVELFPTAYRIAAGHRIRLQVSGGAFPRFARNFGTDEPFGVATAGHRCRYEVFADESHQARITLPFYQ